jgi:hypothetical protein
MALVSTPGSSTANSYGSVAESKAYFALGYKRESWEAIDDNDVYEALLQEGTRIIDTFMSFNGYVPTDSVQALRWPRTAAYDIDNRLIPSTSVPTLLKRALFELAYYIYGNPTGFSLSDNLVDVLRVGPIRIDFSDTAKDSGFPKIVSDMLAPLGSLNVASSNQIKTPKLVRT